MHICSPFTESAAAVTYESVTVGVIFFQAVRPQNYIEPVEENSIEMKTAETVAGPDGAFIILRGNTRS